MQTASHVDGLVGSDLVGWAISDSPDRPCHITVVDETGNVVAEGQASLDRPDLSALNAGRTNFAFEIAGIDLTQPALLRVMADGFEVVNSPIAIGPGYFDGYCLISDGAAEGWVHERTNTFTPPLIQIIDEAGSIVGATIARMPHREDVGAFAPARFRAELDHRCFGRGELHLKALANGVVFFETTCDLTLVGSLDRLSPTGCAGWLLSPGASRHSFTVDVFVDGTLHGQTRCALPRPDVRALHPTCRTDPGFEFAFAREEGGFKGLTTISFRLQGSSVELFDGPYIVGHRHDAVAAARNVARIGLRADTALSSTESSILQQAMLEVLARFRNTDAHCSLKSSRSPGTDIVPNGPRLNVIIPVYRDIDLTRTCIRSVLDFADAATTRVVVINDCSPEPGMADMLRSFGGSPNIAVYHNPKNIGFVRTINRGFGLCRTGDVIILNSDTEVFPGGLEEMRAVAAASPEIATVTAISNNATIFSYPHPRQPQDMLGDIAWADLAAVALRENKGMAIDVPTGHGFCMLIKQEALQRVGLFDVGFGRGYGEENDFCARAADLGYRNVAAPGAFVRHHESASFGADKEALKWHNQQRLDARYPEYTATVMAAERRDVLRSGRWWLDAARLCAASGSPDAFVLIVSHALGGGTKRAIDDIGSMSGYGTAKRMFLSCRDDGYVELSVEDPIVFAVFAPDEAGSLTRLLNKVTIDLVLVHHLLGFSSDVLEQFSAWCVGKRTIIYIHDFYSFCPRVTMINAVGDFCDAAPVPVCERCIDLGGAHAASRMTDLGPASHRAMFAGLLSSAHQVVAPSASAARYLRRAFPDLAVTVIPHPEGAVTFAEAARSGDDHEITLFGAIGPHKGSAKLLEIAQRAKLAHPLLRFRVIGHTDIDERLLGLGNVTITGPYDPQDLAQLGAAATGRLALFLSGWPETYCYTLSEAVQLGFIPLVPDLGALAERVRAAGFGVVFPFPIDAVQVLELIENIAAGKVKLRETHASPSSYKNSPKTCGRAAESRILEANAQFEWTPQAVAG